VPPPPAPRFIRLFLSSTFRDMKADSNEEVKWAFNKLRHDCASRG
jgi:hypothetical protein